MITENIAGTVTPSIRFPIRTRMNTLKPKVPTFRIHQENDICY